MLVCVYEYASAIFFLKKLGIKSQINFGATDIGTTHRDESCAGSFFQSSGLKLPVLNWRLPHVGVGVEWAGSMKG